MSTNGQWTLAHVDGIGMCCYLVRSIGKGSVVRVEKVTQLMPTRTSEHTMALNVQPWAPHQLKATGGRTVQIQRSAIRWECVPSDNLVGACEEAWSSIKRPTPRDLERFGTG